MRGRAAALKSKLAASEGKLVGMDSAWAEVEVVGRQ